LAQLTLVGVGPGDPQLLTVAAVRAIEAAAVVAYPVAREGAEGMAARIAAPWIGPQQRRLPLVFPMVAETEPRQQAWHAAADALAAELLALAQRQPACPVRVIPGISAVSAAAAAASSQGHPWPLALQQEPLLIRPTPETEAELAALLEQAAATGSVLALLKLGHRWSWVQPLLAARGLLEQALFAQRVGWPDQLVQPAVLVSAAEQPYFSLLLIRQGWPAVLP